MRHTELEESYAIIEKYGELTNTINIMKGVDIMANANDTGYSDYELRVKKAIKDVEEDLKKQGP